MARELVSQDDFRLVILTRIPYERMEDPAKVKPVFCRYTKVPVETEASMEKAYEYALSMQRPGEMIYLAGSLYFIGELKKYLKVLKKKIKIKVKVIKTLLLIPF